jgi:hypothetical protein
MTELKKFVVKKSQWLRGEGPSMLLDARTYKMCCLGFASLACGLKENDILGISMPGGVCSDLDSAYPASFFDKPGRESQPIIDIMRINDNPYFNDEERILGLKQKFNELDIEIVFED